MVPGRFLYRRLVRRGAALDLETLSGDLRDDIHHLDSVLGDLIGGEGAPLEIHPDRFLAPGVPRIRPLLVLLSARAVQRELVLSDQNGGEELAVAAEMLHWAIALHDAALGRQGGRRRRAARRLVGGAVGWLGGNHLTLRALELTRQAEGSEALGELLEALREVSEGHVLTQTLQGRTATTSEAMAHAENHTGVVFSFACRVGAQLARAERPVVTGLGRYGRQAGIAWHLAEDISILEQEGDELIFALEDRAAYGHPMLAICLAAERDPRVGELWIRLSQQEDAQVTLELAERVRAVGGLADGRRRLVEASWSARKALHALPASPYRDALDRIAVALAR